MVVSRAVIKRRISEEKDWTKRLIVEPLLKPIILNEVSISLDFHLGNRFAIYPRRRIGHHRPISELFHDISLPEFFVPMGRDLILHPGEVLLGTTLEWFCLPCDLMAYVIGRSIWGRRGLVIATALAVQPASTGLITLELTNVGDVSIYLNPGTCIGQLFFHQVHEPYLDDSGRRSSFSGSGRPQLGEYCMQESEKKLFRYQRQEKMASPKMREGEYCRMSFMGPV